MTLLEEVAALLAEDDAAWAREHPGDSARRQPVHTCYVPADRADAGHPAGLGRRRRSPCWPPTCPTPRPSPR